MISQSTHDKQTEILKAALKLFVNYGFHGTPTSMIAKEAGVANGTLFHYYKTKDELIVALYVQLKKDMGGCIIVHQDNADSIEERCRKFYTAALNWGLNNTVEFRFLQQFGNSPYVQLIPKELQEQSQSWMNVIQEGIKAKIIRPLSPDYIASILSSHLYGVNQYILTANITGSARKKLVNESFEMVWKMISV